MDKTININLGGRNFVISEDGYNILHTYLSNLKEYFRAISPENFEEIVNDFEMRIGEVFEEQINTISDGVITKVHVANVIEQLGNVNDFAGDDKGDGATDGVTLADDSKQQKASPIKKLYRDVHNRLLGGVLAGLASYMGIDKTWLRLIFVLVHFIPYLNYFPFILIYLIMWLIVPPALTVVQQMQMRGEDISTEGIARNVIVDDGKYGRPNIASTILKILFFVVAVPIVFIFVLFFAAVLGICIILLRTANSFPPNKFALLESLDEEVVLGFPVVFIAILLAITVVLLLIRLIFKANVMRYVFVSGTLFIVFGVMFLCGLNKMHNGNGLYRINSYGNLVVNNLPAHDVEQSSDEYEIVAIDTVKFIVSSAEGYEQVRKNYSVKHKLDSVTSLLGGTPTAVLMGRFDEVGGAEYRRSFQPWIVTDGWFGYLGAIPWRSPDAKVCVKPNPDGTFEHVSCKPRARVGSSPSVTLRYVNGFTMKCVDIELYVEIKE